MVTLSLSLLSVGLIVEPWDMMEPLWYHLRLRSFSYWHDSTAVPGIVIYCVFVSQYWHEQVRMRKKSWNYTINNEILLEINM
jgi:hypothetical protein